MKKRKVLVSIILVLSLVFSVVPGQNVYAAEDEDITLVGHSGGGKPWTVTSGNLGTRSESGGTSGPEQGDVKVSGDIPPEKLVDFDKNRNNLLQVYQETK